MSEVAIDANTQVSHTDDSGRTLSGMGATVERLEETMERHAPEPEKPAGTDAVPAAAEVGQAPAPKPSRGQQRFADLTKERDEAKQRADAAEARATAAEAKATPPPPTAREEPPPAAEPSAKPERFTFPSFDKHLEANPTATYEDWELERLEAHAEWRDKRNDIDGRFRNLLDSERAGRAFNDTVEATRVKGRAAYPDFDTIISSGPGVGVKMHATDIVKARQRVAAIFAHPHAEHLEYAILKDGALAQKLAGLDDIGFGIELARLVPTSQPAERRAFTPPPAPMQAVGGNGATTQTPSSELAAKGFDYDKSGYREKRAAERKVGRR